MYYFYYLLFPIQNNVSNNGTSDSPGEGGVAERGDGGNSRGGNGRTESGGGGERRSGESEGGRGGGMVGAIRRAVGTLPLLANHVATRMGLTRTRRRRRDSPSGIPSLCTVKLSLFT